MQIDLETKHDPTSVVVVGSLNVDVVLRARRFPREGETLTGATVSDSLGGKGCNQAVAAARMGARVAMVACLGDDSSGVMALDALRAEGVDVSACRRTAEAATGRAAIVVDEAGRNTIVVADGANALLGREDVERAGELVTGAAIVLCQLEVPIAAVDAAFAAARAAGARTCLNAAPALPIEELSVPPDILIANHGEAETLLAPAGSLPSADVRADAAELAGGLRARYGSALAVVTNGERGAAAVDGTDVVHAPAIPVNARDTTGAGDAFVGALVAELAAGAAVVDALPRACAAGSLATERAGAMPSLPRRAEVLRATP